MRRRGRGKPDSADHHGFGQRHHHQSRAVHHAQLERSQRLLCFCGPGNWKRARHRPHVSITGGDYDISFHRHRRWRNYDHGANSFGKRQTKPKPDPQPQPDPHAEPYADPFAKTYADPQSNSDSNSIAYTYAKPNADAEPDSNSLAHADSPAGIC